MAHFLKGKFKAFHKVGTSECVRDSIRFRQLKGTSVNFELTRRDMESAWGRFWRYENAQITFIPLDEAQPQQGGKVQVKAFVMDFRTFTPQLKTYYGVYSDDFLTFGEFPKAAGNPLDNEELLLQVVSQEETSLVPERTTFRFVDNNLYFQRDVNGELVDSEIEHGVPESKLHPLVDQSWSETFFYGLGNKSV
jgi:hypothetical protein